MNHEAGRSPPRRRLPAPVPEPQPQALPSAAAPQICFFHVHSCSSVLADAQIQKISCSSDALTVMNIFFNIHSMHNNCFVAPMWLFMMKAMHNLSTVSVHGHFMYFFIYFIN